MKRPRTPERARRPKDLAAELEVSERTVFRDLNVLATVGMAVRFDAKSGGNQAGGDRGQNSRGPENAEC